MSQVAYSHDGVGNRTVCLDTVFDSPQTISYDGSSRLTTMTGRGGGIISFTFDANGNLTNVIAAGSLSTLSYDKKNRMVSYANGSGTTMLSYKAQLE